MGILTVSEIIEATGGKIVLGDGGKTGFTGVSIDSKTIRDGELFVALKGERFDGHDFLTEAISKGGGAVVSTSSVSNVKGKTVVMVEDTLRALQDIAHFIRMKQRVVVIGITGTNGKTTTKELVASILMLNHRIMKNTGNLNNHIGLPLSLTRLSDTDEFAILEMGASIRGDIKELCDIAVPDYGVITNIGPAHLEGFGSLEGVRRTKLELFDAVNTIVVNGDDRFLMDGTLTREGNKVPEVITFGIDSESKVRAKDIVLEEGRSFFRLCLSDGGCADLVLHVGGRVNIYNALAAASVCYVLGTRIEEIKKGLESFEGLPMRLELKEIFGATVINDVYNANPASVQAGIKELLRLRKRRAIAILGDMLELGAYAEEEHRRLGKWMSGLPVDVFIATGPMMAIAASEFSANNGTGRKQVMTVSDSSGARRILLDICREGDTVLVKGSRGMHMEEVLKDRRSSLDAVRRENAV
jgi:UDP-N-acetylmuramoyl-tripeptide--D-alanyl-D-alanine ligase